MGIATIKEDIKIGRIRKCYLIYGDEAYLKKLNEKRITDSVMKGCLSPEMNMGIFDGASDINKVTDACDTLPFMCERRLVIVKDSGLFKAGRKSDSEKMTAYIPSLSESICLLFVENDVDKRSSLYKIVNKTGLAENCTSLKESDLIKWAAGIFRRKGIACKNGVLSYFFSVVGTDMENALREIEKLISYKLNVGEITKNDIDAICTKTLESKVFDLVAMIGKRKSAEAVRIYHELLTAREAPFMILSMVARQFRSILQCQNLTKEGKTRSEIVSFTGLRDFVVRDCIAQGKNFTPEMLKLALKDCLDTDFAIKTGAVKDDLAVEMLIISHSS